jgi:hypothetical protein
MEKALKNPFYYGMMRVNDKLYPPCHPIITKELFDEVSSEVNGA